MTALLAAAALALTVAAPPGAPPYDEALVQKLSAAWAARPAHYEPRTRHRAEDGAPRFLNRLFLESSPYLLQHAHNPVDWHAWGDEPFDTARRLGRPVLLSIGYSTCHWCHVMEEESFEDVELARTLNERYVAIKVDREERPDIDAVYMAAVQALGGSGGWPATLWLTPDRKPFFAATYLPPHDGDRGIAVGFLTRLHDLRAAYDKESARAVRTSSEVAAAIQKGLGREEPSKTLPEARALEEAIQYYRGELDAKNGGLRGAPKFPADLPVRFLLRYERRHPDAKLLDMARLTLTRMSEGGLHDQVGGGFHRYSTDERWRVPHFEKMLYDNALLATAYLDAYQATGRADFAAVARDILEYVRRDMTAPDGRFYSATDADSLNPDGHHEEGAFFTWTPAELVAALGREEARMAASYYGVTDAGDLGGRSVLRVAADIGEVARASGRTAEAVRTALEGDIQKLRAARTTRPAPLRDDKTLAGWNGLMIAAYAQAALVLGEPSYAELASRAADAVLTEQRKDGRLLRSDRGGRAGTAAYLSDYAFMTAGLLNLYEASGEGRWLREAKALDTVLERFYEDADQGGFYMTANDAESLLAREKPSTDGAEPSGNSVAALNLLRLYELTSDEAYRRRAERTLRAFGARLRKAPATLSEMLLAVDFALDRPKEIVIVAPHSRQEAEPFLAALRRVFVPNRVLSVAVAGDDLAAQAALVPNLSGKVARGGAATAYVCERQVCKLPTTDPAAFAAQLAKQRSPD